MAQPTNNRAVTGELRQRRSSHDDPEDFETVDDISNGSAATSHGIMPHTISHVEIMPHEGWTPLRTTVHEPIHPHGDEAFDTTQNHLDTSARASASGSSASPILTIDTLQVTPSNSSTPSLSSATASNPVVMRQEAGRSPTSPTSPARRDRGYSLRRVVFAKGFGSQPDKGSIELAGSGPSSGNPPDRFASNTVSNRNGKKNETSVTVSPVFETAELPPRPDMTKKHTSAMSLPNYNKWAKERKRPVFISKLEATYEQIKRRVLRIQEIPPSKDGRHIDLDPFRAKPLLDERTKNNYVSNIIRSCRYTLWNFLPKQIIFQFGKLANFYFLMISILQLIPGLSTTGTYTTIVPLLIFISISMAKEGYDDIRRYKLDKAENTRETTVVRPYKRTIPNDDPEDRSLEDGALHWTTIRWEDVKVGDIVRLDRDESVPADILLLHSDGLNGVAFIETMALDGETNLKPKQAPPPLAKSCQDINGIANCTAHIVVEDPNIDLYNFEGRLTVHGETLPLTTNEIVYRGSVLRNTPRAIGMVINTGEECKIRMNANKNPRLKAPSLQALVNQVVIIVVVVVLLIASICTIAYQVWSRDVERKSWYISRARVAPGPIFVGFIIMFNTMIPLSLYVSMEIIKLGQLYLMFDVDMYDPVSDTPMEAHTTTINEELGQVSYIFSDKTGTLTDNVMRFRKLSVAGVAWLHDTDLRMEAAELATGAQTLKPTKWKGKARKPFSKSSSTYFDEAYAIVTALGDRPSMSTVDTRWKSTARPAKAQPELNTDELLQYLQHKPHGVFSRKARFFLLSLALCHTCLPEVQNDGSFDFQAASPDELALVRAARDLGYMVVDRAAQTITLKTKPSGPRGLEITEVYEILDVIEFSSKRKRMSIIVRFPDGRRCIFCKGADSIVMKRLKHSPLAIKKAAEVGRRASIRKSLEAEQALRRQSEGSPRNSLSMPRTSLGNATRPSLAGHKLRPIRDEIDSWLRERETDVDLTSVDNPAAYSMPRTSTHMEPRLSSVSSTDAYSSDHDDDYYDGMVDEEMAMNESTVFERCFQHIDDFATEGLRTLLYGYKFIDEQDYLSWKKVFHEASTSLVNRQELIEKAGDMIEQDFDLAGATAIEDKLQKGVPETIDKLRRANIKMWMLTGDKRETAINIGHSCRLIKDYSNVIILNHDMGDVDQVMASALYQISNGGVAHSVVVVDGQTLAEIESDEILALLFFDLAVIADSVICCRASPSQKALLVRKIRNKVEGSVTLAVGDGANDIAMIQEAHIGIGITGKEGLQAARVSDYAIAQFRFLQKLILVHGRWNYNRTCKYVLGTFWKELLFYLTQALYQHANGYSGTSLYESWSLSMFNTLFTSLPVIALGIFEQDLEASTLLAVPELYTYGQRNEGFNLRKYFSWMFMAVVEGLMIFFVMYAIYAVPSLMLDNGIFALGDLSFSCCVIIINTKLLFLEMHRKTVISLCAWGLSVAGWTLWNLLLSLIYSNKTSLTYSVRSGFIRHFGGNGIWWVVLLGIVSSFVIWEFAVSSVHTFFWPTDVDIFQELEQDKVISRRFQEAAAGTEIYDTRNDTASKREDEIQDLLNSPRLMPEQQPKRALSGRSPLGRRGGGAAAPADGVPDDAFSPTDTRKSGLRQSTDVMELASLDVSSRPSADLRTAHL